MRNHFDFVTGASLPFRVGVNFDDNEVTTAGGTAITAEAAGPPGNIEP